MENKGLCIRIGSRVKGYKSFSEVAMQYLIYYGDFLAFSPLLEIELIMPISPFS